MKQQLLELSGASLGKGEISSVFYVYAIMQEDLEESLPGLGIDGVHKIERIRCQGLQALVSKVPYDSFNMEVLKERAGDSEWLEKAVRSHTDIVNGIKQDGGVIPMRFLTLCKDEEEVESYLSTYSDEIHTVLDSVRGAQEWGVKLFCDTNKLQHFVEAQDPSENLANDMSPANKGTSFLLQKKKKRRLKETLLKMCAECKEDCHAQLTSLARSSEVIPSQNRKATEGPEPIIFNGAYLIGDDQASMFFQRIEDLSSQLKEKGFELSVSGPWPPYHFVKQLS